MTILPLMLLIYSKYAKFCKKTRTNSQQIGKDFFSKTTLFHWLKFKSIQICEMVPTCKR
jgi:hypothetical protein